MAKKYKWTDKKLISRTNSLVSSSTHHWSDWTIGKEVTSCLWYFFPLSFRTLFWKLHLRGLKEDVKKKETPQHDMNMTTCSESGFCLVTFALPAKLIKNQKGSWQLMKKWWRGKKNPGVTKYTGITPTKSSYLFWIICAMVHLFQCVCWQITCSEYKHNDSVMELIKPSYLGSGNHMQLCC